jgi:hypothetical protein
MERVSVARLATAKFQGWIHAARGMGVSGSAPTELNSYTLLFIIWANAACILGSSAGILCEMPPGKRFKSLAWLMLKSQGWEE